MIGRIDLNLMKAALVLLLTLGGVSCTTSTAPTAADLDRSERRLREAARHEYAMLDQQRASGELSDADYAESRRQLDHRIQNQVDSLAWSRHALAQSELKALGIPTPDQPVQNLPPGLGQTQGSLYNAMRTTGMGNSAAAGAGGSMGLGAPTLGDRGGATAP